MNDQPRARHTADTITDDELDQLYAELAEYRNATTWQTNCLSCSRTLDSAYRETMRAEQAEAELAENTGVLQALRRQRDGAEADLKHAEAALAQARQDWGYATGLLIQAVEQLPAGSVRDQIRDTLGDETR